MASSGRLRLLILAGGVAAAALAGLLFLLRGSSDGLDGFPHAFVAAPGYDPAQVAFVFAPLGTCPVGPAGMRPAWRCDDPAFNDRSGRPWIIPIDETAGMTPPTLPCHPLLGRPPASSSCSRYLSPEAERQLEAYRRERSP